MKPDEEEMKNQMLRRIEELDLKNRILNEQLIE